MGFDRCWGITGGMSFGKGLGGVYSNLDPLLPGSRKCTIASSWIIRCISCQEKIKLCLLSRYCSPNCEATFLLAQRETAQTTLLRFHLCSNCLRLSRLARYHLKQKRNEEWRPVGAAKSFVETLSISVGKWSAKLLFSEKFPTRAVLLMMKRNASGIISWLSYIQIFPGNDSPFLQYSRTCHMNSCTWNRKSFRSVYMYVFTFPID